MRRDERDNNHKNHNRNPATAITQEPRLIEAGHGRLTVNLPRWQIAVGQTHSGLGDNRDPNIVVAG